MMKLPLRTIHHLLWFTPAFKCQSCDHFKTSLESGYRHIHGTSNKLFWEPNRKGTTEYNKEDGLSNKEHFKRGSKMLIPETKKWLAEVKEYFAQDPPPHMAPVDGVIDKYFVFNGPDSLENWVVSADSDFDGGLSTASVSLSQSGSGLFTGNICTHATKTGQNQNAGFANLRFVPPLRSFAREPTYEFEAYTHLALRVRGDGRNYMVNLHPHAVFDISWLNMYSYVLHTRGGPYWQETKIPFSKFFLHYKGRIQDQQYPIDLTDLRNFSISLMDRNNGPFSLEIDYVGCVQDPNHIEEFAYEQYYVPRWSGVN